MDLEYFRVNQPRLFDHLSSGKMIFNLYDNAGIASIHTPDQPGCITVMDLIEPSSINLAVTDPPYLIDYKTNHRQKESVLTKKIANDSNPAIIRRYMQRMYRILKPGGAMYCFCRMEGTDGEDLLGFFKKQITKAGFRIKNTIIWVKDNWTAGDLEGQFGYQYEVIVFAHKERHKIRGHRHSDIWHCDRVTEAERIHPNQKPLLLLKKAMDSSSDPGDIVFDGFSGSGSMGIAAWQIGRRAIMCEMSPEIYKLQNDWIKSETETDLFSMFS